MDLDPQRWNDFLDHDYTTGEQLLGGQCPICNGNVEYRVHGPWFRDLLVCPSCEGFSIPRERAIVRAIQRLYPRFRDLEIHEAAAADRGASVWLKANAPRYSCSRFDPSQPLGAVINGHRNENLEDLTFPDESLDLLISLDVMEHVNRVDLVMKEAARVLRPDGALIFTTPTFKTLEKTQRRAFYHSDGTIETFAPPEFHGSEQEGRSVLVTYHFGYDLPELILRWSGLSTDVIRTVNPSAGILGEHTEVYVCTK